MKMAYFDKGNVVDRKALLSDVAALDGPTL